jgi:hypothetical protein
VLRVRASSADLPPSSSKEAGVRAKNSGSLLLRDKVQEDSGQGKGCGKQKQW